MNTYDSHMHSENSHDGRFSVDEIAETAIDMGLKGITVTDHFDCELYKCKNDFMHIYKSCADIEKASEKYELEIYKGAEIGDWMYAKENGNYCIRTCNFDFILASLHSSSTGRRAVNGFKSYKSFLVTNYEDDIRFLDLFFKNLKYTVLNADYDAVAHLTYPLRYLNGMCNKNMTLDNYEKDIEDILKIIIEREKALEINTSGFKNSLNDTMPYEKIIRQYYDMGGRLITVGSDAHKPEHIALGFDKTFKMLKNIGFENYYIYKSRKPVPVSIL